VALDSCFSSDGVLDLLGSNFSLSFVPRLLSGGLPPKRAISSVRNDVYTMGQKRKVI
jgi:hypothetical protein